MRKAGGAVVNSLTPRRSHLGDKVVDLLAVSHEQELTSNERRLIAKLSALAAVDRFDDIRKASWRLCWVGQLTCRTTRSTQRRGIDQPLLLASYVLSDTCMHPAGLASLSRTW